MTRAVIVGGLIAGALDATFAVIVYVITLRAFTLLGVLQWIATGALGGAAFAAMRVPVLRSQAVASGALYGAAV